MPTVELFWNGQCHGMKIQQSLCLKMSELYEISARLYKGYFQGDIKKMQFDGDAIPGKVLLSSFLFYNQTIPSTLEKVGQNLYASERISLYGIQFPLFDPRKFNSPLMLAHDDYLGFIFLRSADPELNGRMVEVLDPSKYLGGSEAKDCQYLLVTPQIDLRYYLERWIGELLGWVKHFYVPNLSYWAWVDNPGYAGYEQISPDDCRSRDEIFFYLHDAFKQEAEAWISSCRKYQKESRMDNGLTGWIEIESERLDQLALKEKRLRNHGT